MSSKTLYQPLGDFVSLLSGNTPSKADPSYWGGDIPWVSAKDMSNFWIADSEDHLTERGVSAASRLVPAGSVLMLTRGMTLHKRVPICKVAQAVTFNQDVKAVLPKQNLSGRFLPYLLTGNHERLHAKVDSAGHGTGRLNTDAILSLPVWIPDVAEQERIADVGEALDDRITLLRETNATLEAIAQALFKSWFVDFDPVRAKMQGRAPEGIDEDTVALFPDAFEESELGAVPRGWRTAEFGEILELTKGCSYKGDGLSEFNGAYMFNLGCFNAHRIFATQKVKRYTGDYKPHHEVVAGDLIIANTDMTQSREILGRPVFVPDGMTPGFISHHVFRVKVKVGETRQAEALRAFIFFALQQNSFRERAIGFATGTTVLALPAAAVLGSPICLPTEQTLEKFSDVVRPIFQKIRENEKQADLFSDARDTLLPRLISGQLRLPEAQAELEAVDAV